jgi:hypothetical protein
VSASSEFQRILADTVAFLRRSEADEATTLARGLADAGVHAREDLADGAARVVDLLESQDFDHQAAHLRAICRAILGR